MGARGKVGPVPADGASYLEPALRAIWREMERSGSDKSVIGTGFKSPRVPATVLLSFR
jgi:hypothetical protein